MNSNANQFSVKRHNMVEGQIRVNNIQSPSLLNAMATLEREGFVDPAQQAFAYSDAPLPLLYDGKPIIAVDPATKRIKRTMLSPLTQAKLLDYAEITPQDNLLVIGANYGYLSSLGAKIANFVLAVEQDAQLVKRLDMVTSQLEIDNVMMIEHMLAKTHANAIVKKQAPFNAIIFEGKLEKIPPHIQSLLSQDGIITYIADNSNGVTGIMCAKASNGKLSIIEQETVEADYLPGFEPKPSFKFAS
ncbi:MAG: protein-L-isoaspartate O-methyltransferase [Alphaproteobacteria bacterium]